MAQFTCNDLIAEESASWTKWPWSNKKEVRNKIRQKTIVISLKWFLKIASFLFNQRPQKIPSNKLLHPNELIWNSECCCKENIWLKEIPGNRESASLSRKFQITWVNGQWKKMCRTVSSWFPQIPHLVGPCHSLLMRLARDRILSFIASQEKTFTFKDVALCQMLFW